MAYVQHVTWRCVVPLSSCRYQRPVPPQHSIITQYSFTLRPTFSPTIKVRPSYRLTGRTHAQTTSQSSLNPSSITSALARASGAWDKCDKDRNGCLSLQETTSLLNSDELRAAVQLLTNVPPKHRTLQEVEPYFKIADADKSGALDRSEFLGLYLAIATDRIKKNPVILAEALLGFIDLDRNGKIEGNELKILLALVGFPAAVLLPIPGFVSVDYRSFLGQVSNFIERSK